MWERALEWLSKEGIKVIAKATLFKDGKFNRKRASKLLFFISVGALIYQLPVWLLTIDPVARFIRSLVPIADRPGNLIDHPAYVGLVQVALLLAYVVLLLLASLLKMNRGQIQLAGLLERHRNVIEFVNDVELVYGNRCERTEERQEAWARLAQDIESSEVTRIMAISAYHDLVSPQSPIRQALEKRGRNLRLEVLLLDPFSEYATERATQLNTETDRDRSRYRYIRDHVKVIEVIDHLAKRASLAEYRVYCSKPFFRFYLTEHNFYVQTYQSFQHGNLTPLFNFSSGRKSLFHVGKEMFDYYWRKGFMHTDESLRKMGEPLTLYLATMYGQAGKRSQPPTNLRERILRFVEGEIREARRLDERGVLTEGGR